MMVGGGSRHWFDWAPAELLFVAYILFVTVLLLNVLIAVVSDSYDGAQTRAKKLYLAARLEFVARLDAMYLTAAMSQQRGPLAAAVHASMLRFFHVSAGDDGQHDEWRGRALDMERRMNNVVAAAEGRLNSHYQQEITKLAEQHAADMKEVKAALHDLKAAMRTEHRSVY